MLYHATLAGLDFSIVNTQKLARYPDDPRGGPPTAEDLLFDRGRFGRQTRTRWRPSTPSSRERTLASLRHARVQARR